MFAYCISVASQEAASVARHRRQRCASRRAPMGVHHGTGSATFTDVLREIGATYREIVCKIDVEVGTVYPREGCDLQRSRRPDLTRL